MCSKAVEWKLLPAGHEKPTAYITPFPERKRRRFLSIEELTRLDRVLEELEAEAGAWETPAASKLRQGNLRLIPAASSRARKCTSALNSAAHTYGRPVRLLASAKK